MCALINYASFHHSYFIEVCLLCCTQCAGMALVKLLVLLELCMPNGQERISIIIYSYQVLQVFAKVNSFKLSDPQFL